MPRSGKGYVNARTQFPEKGWDLFLKVAEGHGVKANQALYKLIEAAIETRRIPGVAKRKDYDAMIISDNTVLHTDPKKVKRPHRATRDGKMGFSNHGRVIVGSGDFFDEPQPLLGPTGETLPIEVIRIP